MRLWLKDSERRPDPEPIQTDDRLAIIVGLALWVVALAVVLFLAPLLGAGDGWWLWTCVVGLALGLVGLVYTHLRR
jgi:fatty acid desaturase